MEKDNKGPDQEPGKEMTSRAAGAMDQIRVTVTMELGEAEATLDELLQYTQNTVFELNRIVGDPVDLRVNGRLIGHGEVVTVGEYFGVRVTEVVNRVREDES